jgi:type IV pilus assembly protein PilX
MQFGAPHSSQRGVTLIVSLIFLAILMLLGVIVAQNSSMEERMAGNTRDRDLAFQAAEAALKDAEADASGYDDAAYGTTPGLLIYNSATANNSAHWSAYNWDDQSQTASNSLLQVAEQPRYVIEKLPDVATTKRFRITARGVGASAGTVVILQAGYEK